MNGKCFALVMKAFCFATKFCIWWNFLVAFNSGFWLVTMPVVLLGVWQGWATPVKPHVCLSTLMDLFRVAGSLSTLYEKVYVLHCRHLQFNTVHMLLLCLVMHVFKLYWTVICVCLSFLLGWLFVLSKDIELYVSRMYMENACFQLTRLLLSI